MNDAEHDDVDAYLADQSRAQRTGLAIFGTGILAIVVGVGLLVAARIEGHISWWGLLAIAGGAGLLMLAITYGRGGFSGRAKAAPKVDRAQLRAQVETAALPFWVCGKCHTLSTHSTDGRCPNCESLTECVEVSQEDDRGIALAALEG